MINLPNLTISKQYKIPDYDETILKTGTGKLCKGQTHLQSYSWPNSSHR